VVVAQSYHRNWKAKVDGISIPLWKANHAFQAIQVPAGRHEVVLAYGDPLFTIGLAATILGLGICLALWRRKEDVPVRVYEPAASQEELAA
jgi:uncharacterized membrane protein YfhO